MMQPQQQQVAQHVQRIGWGTCSRSSRFAGALCEQGDAVQQQWARGWWVDGGACSRSSRFAGALRQMRQQQRVMGFR
jgi:hypothetical protein